MSTYNVTVKWQLNDAEFLDNTYSRAHEWLFDGGLTVPASSSPQIVPTPMSVAGNVDPEEAFVASVSSCHMLWFLSLAAKAGFNIKTYTDHAMGRMGLNQDGNVAMLAVELDPLIILENGQQLSSADARKLHSKAHAQCFIANSVCTLITVKNC